ncbi:MAG: exostosin family protein [Gemmatimonadales bacterium]
MRVALKSLLPASSETSQARHLRWLASLDPDCTHEIVAREDDADVVLLTDAPGGPELAKALVADPTVRRHGDRIYIHSEEARPFRLLPGLYTSLARRGGDEEIARAIGYPCWTPSGMNRCIDQAAAYPPQREPDLLYSFVGRRCHPVRDRIFAMAHDPRTSVVFDTLRTYRHFAGGVGRPPEAQRSYVEIALRSRFALCPRGWATSTLRVYEMMALGVAPVILSDRWVPPRGPDWSRCAVLVPERLASELPRILEERADEWRTIGDAAFAAFQEYFSPKRQFRTAMDALADLAPVSAATRRRLQLRWPVTLPVLTVRPLVRELARRHRHRRQFPRPKREPRPSPALVSPSRGYLTMAVGATHYLEMAVDMALSLREHTRFPIAIAVDEPLRAVLRDRYPTVFDEVVLLPPRYMDGRALKYGCAEASPFETTIFVDSDCVVLDDLDFVSESLNGDPVSMVGELLTRADDQVHHGFSTRELMSRFGLDRYLKSNSGLFCFRKSSALEIMDECFNCYVHEARPALRGSIVLGRWVGDEIAFGIVGGRRRLSTLPQPAPMYWPREIERLDLVSPTKPLLHMLWPLPDAALERLVETTAARRRLAGLPGDTEHWRTEARSLKWMARRHRLRDRLARPLRRPHIA